MNLKCTPSEAESWRPDKEASSTGSAMRTTCLDRASSTRSPGRRKLGGSCRDGRREGGRKREREGGKEGGREKGREEGRREGGGKEREREAELFTLKNSLQRN